MTRPKRPLFPETRRQSEALGARLRAARRRRGMSIAEVAARVLASEPTIARLEHGDPAVSLAVLYRVLEVLGLQADIDRVAEHDELGHQIADSRLGRPRRAPTRTLADDL